MIERYDIYGHCYYCGNGETHVDPNESGDWVMYDDYRKDIISKLDSILKSPVDDIKENIIELMRSL